MATERVEAEAVAAMAVRRVVVAKTAEAAASEKGAVEAVASWILLMPGRAPPRSSALNCLPAEHVGHPRTTRAREAKELHALSSCGP